MMTEQATKSGVSTAEPFTVKGSDGRVHKLSPLRFLEIRDLERHLTAMPLQRVAASLPLMDDQVSSDLLELAYNDSKKIRVGSPEFDAEVMSFEGVMLVAWLSIRITEPEIKLEEVMSSLEAYADPASTAAILEAAGYSTKPKKNPEPVAIEAAAPAGES